MKKLITQHLVVVVVVSAVEKSGMRIVLCPFQIHNNVVLIFIFNNFAIKFL